MADVQRADRADEVAITERRVRVAQLYARCQTQQQIARQLGVSQQLVSFDLKAIKRQWRQEMSAEIGERMERDLMALDEMERDAVLNYTRALMPVVENEDGTQTIHVGDALPWAQHRLKIMERRAKMLGFDVPEAPKPGGEENGGDELDRARREFAQALVAVADEGEARRRVERALAAGSVVIEGGLGDDPGASGAAAAAGRLDDLADQ